MGEVSSSAYVRHAPPGPPSPVFATYHVQALKADTTGVVSFIFFRLGGRLFGMGWSMGIDSVLGVESWRRAFFFRC